jgi:hypothetical protein
MNAKLFIFEIFVKCVRGNTALCYFIFKFPTFGQCNVLKGKIVTYYITYYLVFQI